MPQVTLEYSKNIGKFDHQQLFKQIHEVLTTITAIESCKSRAICHEDYYIGNGDRDNALVFLRIAILSGRDEATKQKVGQQCFDIVKSFFADIAKANNLICHPTVEICDLQTYFKS